MFQYFCTQITIIITKMNRHLKKIIILALPMMLAFESFAQSGKTWSLQEKQGKRSLSHFRLEQSKSSPFAKPFSKHDPIGKLPSVSRNDR